MRPGYNPWATGDLYTTPPSVGTATKFEPTATLRLEGFHGNDFAGPGFVNWMLHRLHLLQQEGARVRAKNIVPCDASAGGVATQTLSSFVYDEANDRESMLLFSNGPPQAHESSIVGGEIWPAHGGALWAGAGAITHLDAAATEQGTRHVVIGGVNDTVATSVWPAAWGVAAFAAGPAANWTAIGCDRATSGAPYKFIVGEDGLVGGAHAPLVKVSTAAVPAYTTIAGFPALAAGTTIRGIHHSQHPAAALGPGDAGNPTWLVLTDNEAVRSADGVVWTSAAHGFAGGALHARCAAYSRTSGRWVVALQGASAGNIEYSDDNGATWTLVTGAFNALTGTVHVIGDGYGTFVAWEKSTGFFVSVDEGLTWEAVAHPVDPTGATHSVVVGFAENSSLNVDDVNPGSSAFYFGDHDTAGPGLTIYRSQRT